MTASIKLRETAARRTSAAKSTMNIETLLAERAADRIGKRITGRKHLDRHHDEQRHVQQPDHEQELGRHEIAPLDGPREPILARARDDVLMHEHDDEERSRQSPRADRTPASRSSSCMLHP